MPVTIQLAGLKYKNSQGQFQSADCLKGEKGDPGENGLPGAQGPQGAQGIQGPKGDKGDKGDTGETGSQGPKGDKGDTGATGSQGPKGDKGDPGADADPTDLIDDTTPSLTKTFSSSKISTDHSNLLNEISEMVVVTDVTYDDEDLENYTSVESVTSANQTAVVIAPNETDPYYVKSATVKAMEGVNIKFSVFKIEPYYITPDPYNRKKFIKLYDIAIIKTDSDGNATITFDVPLKLTALETVLVATCKESTTTNRMKYGTYDDALYTIYEYDKNWYDLAPGEFYDNGSGYEYPSANHTVFTYCAYYSIDYVLAEDADAITRTPTDILQEQNNYSQYDSEINEHSNNAVKNSALYEELNITKTETITPVETTYSNTAVVNPGGYIATAVSIELPTTREVKVKKIELRAKTGETVKFGKWSFRRYSDDPESANYNRGYFTLEEVLGTVEASDTVAALTLDDYEIDPVEDILIATCETQSIGYAQNVSNDVMPLYVYNTDSPLIDATVGVECSTLYYYRKEAQTTQPVYKVTYELKDSYVVTTVKSVKDTADDLTDDVKTINSKINDIQNSGSSSDGNEMRKPVNKFFCVIVDDVTRDALTIADDLLSIGVRPAYAFKMESLGVDITWEELQKLQSLGFEICFHGILHSRYPAGTAPVYDDVMIADIKTYKELCAEHGIVLHGYAGPNHYPLPVGAFNEFEWARSPYGLDVYGTPGHLGTTFASVGVWSCDPTNNAIPKQDMIDEADNVGANQYLVPMCHTQNLVTYLDDYLEVFNSWIEDGLQPIRPMDAVRQGLFNAGGLGNNSTFAIQAGTATGNYFTVAGNGTIKTNWNPYTSGEGVSF